MSLQYSLGYVDSTTTPKSLSIPDLSYAKDFSISKSEASEVVLTNMTTPIDQVETIRFAMSNVNDVYQGTGIDPNYYGISRKGFSLLVQNNLVLRITDDAKPEFQMDIPISIHSVIRSAKSQYLSIDTLQTALLRHVSTFYPTGSVDTSRLNELIRGALLPSGI